MVTELEAEKYQNRDMFRSAISEASFMLPNWIKASAWIQHAPFAFFITEAVKPKIFVELGTHYGYSFFAICQAVVEYNLSTKCYAVDTWQGDEHAGFYDDRIYKDVEQHMRDNYSSFANLKRMTFDEALKDFSDGSVDLLHVDGRHFYDDVKHDFTSWIPKLSERAIVMFHDTQVRERGFGVYQFWEQLATIRPAFEFHHGHGLGVLCAGNTIPENLIPLFQAQNNIELTTVIRNAYYRLGQSIELITR
jgi:hypothetical protein